MLKNSHALHAFQLAQSCTSASFSSHSSVSTPWNTTWVPCVDTKTCKYTKLFKMLQKPYHIIIFTPNNLLDFLTAIASILAILVTCEPIYHIYLSGVGCLFSFSAFRMGAYSRWALIRGWALTRRNAVSVWIHLHVTTKVFSRGAGLRATLV